MHILFLSWVVPRMLKHNVCFTQIVAASLNFTSIICQLMWAFTSGVSMASLTELSFNWTGFISAMISNIAFTYRSIYSKKAMVRSYKAPTSSSSPDLCIADYFYVARACVFLQFQVPYVFLLNLQHLSISRVAFDSVFKGTNESDKKTGFLFPQYSIHLRIYYCKMH